MLCTGMETWYSTQYISKQARYSLCRENMGKRQQETPIIIVIYIILYLCHEFLLTVSTFQTLYFFADLPMNIMTQWCHLPWTIFQGRMLGDVWDPTDPWVKFAMPCFHPTKNSEPAFLNTFSSTKTTVTQFLKKLFINESPLVGSCSVEKLTR